MRRKLLTWLIVVALMVAIPVALRQVSASMLCPACGLGLPWTAQSSSSTSVGGWGAVREVWYCHSCRTTFTVEYHKFERCDGCGGIVRVGR